MQNAHSDFPHSQQEYEHFQEASHLFEYESRIDAGEKIMPPVRERKRAHLLGLRLLIALISLAVLVLVCTAILLTPAPQFPDLTNLHLVFAIFGVSSIDAIIYLLLDRLPGKPARKGIGSRLIFAITTGFLTPVVCWMMIQGANGSDGVLLVLLITLNSNIISYLTACEKRRPPSKN